MTTGRVDQAPGRNVSSRPPRNRSQYAARYAPTASPPSSSTLSNKAGRRGRGELAAGPALDTRATTDIKFVDVSESEALATPAPQNDGRWSMRLRFARSLLSQPRYA